jgi:hypothetical protein
VPSSNEGDVVLDPLCGCATAIAVAQRLGRRWIGIDITNLAITLIKVRLRDAFGDAVQHAVVGEPVSVPDAEALAQQAPYQFHQWWALGLVGARPVEQKKGTQDAASTAASTSTSGGNRHVLRRNNGRRRRLVAQADDHGVDGPHCHPLLVSRRGELCARQIRLA